MLPSRPLRVLHLSTMDRGGAGVACLRLHHALRDIQVDSRVLVNKRDGSDAGVFQTGSRWTGALRYRLDRLPLQAYRHKKLFASWSVNWVRVARAFRFADWEPDILHAHWIGDGFISLESLANAGKPVVWTMHDMWPFSGGCHYARECHRYETGCGACPQLGSSSEQDLSARSSTQKKQAWSRLKGIAVSPGSWLADEARHSTVMKNARIDVIPNGLDGNLFKPVDRREARQRLGLRNDEIVVLTGAVGAVKDERKGFSLLTDAIRACSAMGVTQNWRLLVFGADGGPGLETMGIPVSYCGVVNDERDLPVIYSAADVYTLPSLQDNLPNTVVEAMACGTPLCGFRSSGLATMIQEGVTGVLAEPFSTDELAAAIREVVARPPQAWRDACRADFENVYAWPGPARKYMDVYKELLEN